MMLGLEGDFASALMAQQTTSPTCGQSLREKRNYHWRSLCRERRHGQLPNPVCFENYAAYWPPSCAGSASIYGSHFASMSTPYFISFYEGTVSDVFFTLSAFVTSLRVMLAAHLHSSSLVHSFGGMARLQEWSSSFARNEVLLCMNEVLLSSFSKTMALISWFHGLCQFL